MVRRYCHNDLYVRRLPKHAGPVLHALTGRHVLHGQGGSGQQRHPNQRHHVATLKQQQHIQLHTKIRIIYWVSRNVTFQFTNYLFYLSYWFFGEKQV